MATEDELEDIYRMLFGGCGARLWLQGVRTRSTSRTPPAPLLCAQAEAC